MCETKGVMAFVRCDWLYGIDSANGIGEEESSICATNLLPYGVLFADDTTLPISDSSARDLLPCVAASPP